MQRTASISDEQSAGLADVVDEHASRDGAAPAFLFGDTVVTYGGLARRSNLYARWALAQGFRPGDTVALMLPNCPDYVAIWLGLSRVGVVTALLNTQLTDAALGHCVAIADVKALIVGQALLAVVTAIGLDVPLWTHGLDATCSTPRVDMAAEAMSDAALSDTERPSISLRQRALLIYTSGTTGLPKAANVSHYRVLMWSQWFAGLMDVKPDDRLYDCLPMYHSVGGVVAVGSMLAGGGSVVVRERFSATRFWDDVAETGCTIFQYIGELCRYLVNQPPRPEDRAHKLRLCCGNGLRADIWERFQARFDIPQILEFYAATEGSFSLFNVEGKPGAIGKIPAFMAHRSPVALVRFDPETNAPRRSSDGFCQRCAPDEPGEAIGRLAAGEGGLAARFEGYTSQGESDRKILRDVFSAGDAWFRTGDLMRRDAKGFYYFVDRVGDTFRWKGENVAASEIEMALADCPGVLEANVYGVTVPGSDGRAGMAALVVDEHFNMRALRERLLTRLPAYARPIFLRIRPALDVTGTFKQPKHTLINEGYDPSRIDDPLYVDDAALAAYVRLDPAHYGRIQSGGVRL